MRGADLEGGSAAAEVGVEFGGDGSVGGWDVGFQDPWYRIGGFSLSFPCFARRCFS